MHNDYTICTRPNGRYSVVGWGPVYYAESYTHAVLVRDAMNAIHTPNDLTTRDKVLAIIADEPRAAVSGPRVLTVCAEYHRRASR